MRSFLILSVVFAMGCGGSDDESPASGDDASTVGDSATPVDSGGTGVDTGTSTPVTDAAGLKTYGTPYTGGEFHLGPVDYNETKFHNACAPGTKYAPAVRSAEGSYLAGLWSGIPNVAGYCDACIKVDTAKGKSLVLRVVTYGSTTTNSIDVSPEAYAILNSGEYPRSMTWQFVMCPESGPVMYEFQTGANEWWTSLWVRNARAPLAKVEVKSKNHASFAALSRSDDGTLNDGGGFGRGPFTLRLTSLDGTTVEDTFDWPSPDIAGKTLIGKGNF